MQGIRGKWKIAGIIIIILMLVYMVFLTIWNIRLSRLVTKNSVGEEDKVSLCLPDVYYVAEGLTMDIYNSQITSLGTHITKYSILWECEVGECLERKYQIVAEKGMTGEYDLSATIFDDNLNELAKKTITLKIVPAMEKEFSILEIGDSLSIHGELYTRLQELDGNKMICNGTRGYEGYLTEGRMGFSAEDYLNETSYDLEEGEECHPFYNPDKGRFDWNYYKEKTGFNPDIVEIFLGTNNLLNGDSNGENILKIVDYIREDDSKIPIYVVNTIYPANQNAIGSYRNKKGNLMLPNNYKQERDYYVYSLMCYLNKNLEGRENIYLVPAAISMDSAYNYPMEEVPVNPHSTVTELVPTDALHPNKAGFYQIADVIYSTFCGTMEEEK